MSNPADFSSCSGSVDPEPGGPPAWGEGVHGGGGSQLSQWGEWRRDGRRGGGGGGGRAPLPQASQAGRTRLQRVDGQVMYNHESLYIKLSPKTLYFVV